MGMVGTRINNELDRHFRKLCKDRSLTMAEGLAKAVKAFVGDGLSGGMIKDDIKVEAETMLTSISTIEEKLKKVDQLKLEIDELAEKPFSRQPTKRKKRLVEFFFYDEALANRIKNMKSELNALLQEIEADQKVSKE